jgi:TolA-binding protein
MESHVAQLPLTHRAWAWFETNKKQAYWGALGIVLGGLLITFLVYKHGEKDVVAGQALSVVSIPQLGGGPGPIRADAAQAYLKVAADYPKSPAGARARLMAGASFFADGKYDEARTQFEIFRRDHRESRLLSQALLGIAACLDAQGKTNEATTAYKDLVDHYPGENVVPQAKFSLACLYEGQNKPDLARTLFEDVTRTDPYGSLGSESGMRLEELMKKNPNLAPAIKAPATTTPIPIEKPQTK